MTEEQLRPISPSVIKDDALAKAEDLQKLATTLEKHEDKFVTVEQALANTQRRMQRAGGADTTRSPGIQSTS